MSADTTNRKAKGGDAEIVAPETTPETIQVSKSDFDKLMAEIAELKAAKTAPAAQTIVVQSAPPSGGGVDKFKPGTPFPPTLPHGYTPDTLPLKFVFMRKGGVSAITLAASNGKPGSEFVRGITAAPNVTSPDRGAHGVYDISEVGEVKTGHVDPRWLALKIVESKYFSRGLDAFGAGKCEGIMTHEAYEELRAQQVAKQVALDALDAQHANARAAKLGKLGRPS